MVSAILATVAWKMDSCFAVLSESESSCDRVAVCSFNSKSHQVNQLHADGRKEKGPSAPRAMTVSKAALP